ncbi:hypothetical protein DACRYDRAFT_15499 [Dacryopinax primogenitus]|uniref:Uncharacterized protein n=1 Tax=Dacryopinax primogenitus (strain DJM 731) TaxID=1858805 RepID=M5FZZ6_DACPD|nr:uncharacterized protein DACRYDRAFT_15499 [Dacryopinax primogenitus]EJU02079.1 hypothetical protein DACRYDRAFT_15499 [Dacryopinax primogenitus]
MALPSSASAAGTPTSPGSGRGERKGEGEGEGQADAPPKMCKAQEEMGPKKNPHQPPLWLTIGLPRDVLTVLVSKVSTRKPAGGGFLHRVPATWIRGGQKRPGRSLEDHWATRFGQARLGRLGGGWRGVGKDGRGWMAQWEGGVIVERLGVLGGDPSARAGAGWAGVRGRGGREEREERWEEVVVKGRG